VIGISNDRAGAQTNIVGNGAVGRDGNILFNGVALQNYTTTDF